MEFKKIKERLFKPLKDLNAEIRFIENEQDKLDKTIYWVVDVGLIESLGEQGYIYTLFYNSYPTEEEIIKDIKIHIQEEIKRLENDFCLGYREEQILKELKGVKQ